MSDLERTAVEWFQRKAKHGAIHPLTCGEDSRHAPLRYDETDKLVCPTCGWKQGFVPEFVVNYYKQMTESAD